MRRFTGLLLVGAMMVLGTTSVASAGYKGSLVCDGRDNGTNDGNHGAIASSTQKDTWTFFASAGARVLIDLRGISGNLEPRFALFTGSGTRLDDELEYFEDPLPSGGGNYKVEVTGKGSGDYVLHYWNLKDCSWDSLDCGDPCHAGDVVSTADMDIYQFRGTVGDRILIRPTGGFGPGVDAFMPSGADLVLDRINGRNIGLLYGRLPEDGNNILAVFGPGGTEGRYVLSYVNVDRCSRGTIFCTQTGTLTSGGDMHVYEFKLLKEQAVDVNVRADADAASPVYMHLYEDNRNEPQYANANVLTGSAEAPTRSRTFKVVVYAGNALAEKESGYTITLKGKPQTQLQGRLTIAPTENGKVEVSSTTDDPEVWKEVRYGEPDYYPCGATVKLAATADAGYRFGNWTRAVIEEGKAEYLADPLLTFKVDDDYMVQAEFIRVHTLKVTSAWGGSVKRVPHVDTYDAGDSVEVTATPADGYRFEKWTGTPVDANQMGANPITLMMDKDYELQASFIRIHTLAVSWSDGGSVDFPTGLLDHGTSALLVTRPKQGYRFVGWTGIDASQVLTRGEPNEFTVKVDGDYQLRAEFERIMRTLTISTAGVGTVTPAGGRHEYAEQAQAEVTAIPGAGHEFQSWSGGAAQVGQAEIREGVNVFKIIMLGNYELQANFRPRRALPQVRTLGVESITPTSVSLQGELVADGNDVCVCWFRYGTESLEFETPKVPGTRSGEIFRQMVTGLRCGTTYYFQAWAENSLGSGPGEIRNFTPVLLTVSADEGGTVSQPGLGAVFGPEPRTVEIRAEPVDGGHYFWYWAGSAVDAGKLPGGQVTAPDANVYVDANDTLRAMFLRALPTWEDDVDRAGRRGGSFSTSQLWDFGDRADGTAGVPQDLCEVTGAAPGGRPPLPGTSLAWSGQDEAAGSRWWSTDPFAPTARRGLLAADGLRASINTWQSQATATSVWVQVVWRPYENAEVGLFPQDAPAELDLTDVDPPRLAFRLLAEEYLLQGWRRSTYAWDLAPSPAQVRFTLRGRVVIDSVIVDTYTEEPAAPEEIHVDDDAAHDPGPDDIAASDPLEDGTAQRPFDSVQEAIDVAPEGAIIVVHEGRYRESLDVPGKAITITARWLTHPKAYAPSIIDAGGSGPAVRLRGKEGADCVLSGLTIMGGTDPNCAALLCQGGSPTIAHCIMCGNTVTGDEGALVLCRDSRARFINCTLADNRIGSKGAAFSLANSDMVLLNSIVWGNRGPMLRIISGPGPGITYSDIEGGWPGLGVLNADPCFASAGYWHDAGTPQDPADDLWFMGDYHLRSLQGRFDARYGTWVSDAMSSPCLDAGSLSAIWTREPEPQGGRTNMGVYGGTIQASKSTADAP